MVPDVKPPPSSTEAVLIRTEFQSFQAVAVGLPASIRSRA